MTHDFEDAATLADRVGVVVDGRLLQVGTPSELVAAPSDPFVARFTGANLLPGAARADAGGLTEVVLDAGGTMWSADTVAGRVALTVYPWEVALSREVPDDSAVNHLAGADRPDHCRSATGHASPSARSSPRSRRPRSSGSPFASASPIVASFKATAARLLPLA